MLTCIGQHLFDRERTRMDAQEIINYHCYFQRRRLPLSSMLRSVRVLLCRMDLLACMVRGASKVVFGDWSELKSVVEQNADAFEYF